MWPRGCISTLVPQGPRGLRGLPGPLGPPGDRVSLPAPTCCTVGPRGPTQHQPGGGGPPRPTFPVATAGPREAISGPPFPLLPKARAMKASQAWGLGQEGTSANADGGLGDHWVADSGGSCWGAWVECPRQGPSRWNEVLCGLLVGFRSEAQVLPLLYRVPSGSEDPPGSQEAPGKRYVGPWGWRLFVPSPPPPSDASPAPLGCTGPSWAGADPWAPQGRCPWVHLSRSQWAPQGASPPKALCASWKTYLHSFFWA